MQLGLGPAAQRVAGELRRPAARRDHDPEDGAGFADGIRGIEPPPHAVGDVGGVAGEQIRQGAIVARDSVPHGSAARHFDRLFVDEDAERLRHHRLPAA